MFDLPLFPLQTVLFPGMPITLHIFEERYKTMVRHCMRTKTPFGVVLIRRGTEAHGPLAEPYDIGCTAHVTQIETLDESHMNLVAIGVDRFRIRTLDDSTQPYLVGEVELAPMPNRDPDGLAWEIEHLRPLIERYIHLLAQADGTLVDSTHQLPDAPLVLAHLAAMILQIPPEQKQPLLAAENTTRLLRGLRELYRREVALLHDLLVQERRQDTGRLLLN